MTEIRSTALDVAWIAAVAALISVVVAVRASRHDKQSAAVIHHLVTIWLVATLVGLAYLTLSPIGAVGSRPGSNLNPLAEIDMRNAFGNMLLFVPVGFMATLAFRSAPRPVATGVLFSLAASIVIEATQWLVGLGRSADIQDLILNTAGGLVGALAAIAIRKWTSLSGAL